MDNPIPRCLSSEAIGLRNHDPCWPLQARNERGTANPFVPAKAGTQSRTGPLSLDPRVSGDERSEGLVPDKTISTTQFARFIRHCVDEELFVVAVESEGLARHWSF